MGKRKKFIFWGRKGEWYLQNVYLVYRNTKKEWRKKMDISKDKLFALGKEEGRQQLMNHIEHQYEIGKPVEINGKLYWLKDARQNLCDIMDDLEAEWEAECGSKKFIVPITCSYTNGEIKRDVIIETDRAETAALIAIRDFQHNGWVVDTDYKKYRQFRG